ncbi:hypothetical protein EAE96_002839 [Botrytis aclada]|nr:hypothetical protein EAE96_002839 [Botrytis aclada]
MEFEKGSTSSASSISDGKTSSTPDVTRPSYFNRLALRLFPKTRGGFGKSNCFTGLDTNSSTQSLASSLATVYGAEEKVSGAANTKVGFNITQVHYKLPRKGYYSVQTGEGYLDIPECMFNQQSRPLFDMIFGKDSLKDINAVPAAILPKYNKIILGIFAEWTRSCASKPMISGNMFHEVVCTRKERVQTVGVIMELLFFAEEYNVHEFQDEILELFINTCKEDNLPLDVSHVKACHKRTTQNSKIRAFFIDFMLFIIQNMDHPGVSRVRETVLNCDLSFKNEKVLVGLLRSLSGGKIGSSVGGKLPDPRDAPSCVYHHHGRDENCPHKVFASSSVFEIHEEKA